MSLIAAGPGRAGASGAHRRSRPVPRRVAGLRQHDRAAHDRARPGRTRQATPAGVDPAMGPRLTGPLRPPASISPCLWDYVRASVWEPAASSNFALLVSWTASPTAMLLVTPEARYVSSTVSFCNPRLPI